MSWPSFKGGAHEGFLPALVRLLDVRHYLELGLAQGTTFCRVAPIVLSMDGGAAIGVDPQLSFIAPGGSKLFGQTTDDFFATSIHTLGEDFRFDFTFIDADHRYEQARRDLDNALRHTISHGIVCLHDTWPTEPWMLADGYCSDSWKLAAELTRPGSGWGARVEAVTLPYGPGLTIVRNRERHLSFEPEAG